MTDCPIGFICDLFQCDLYGSGYCQELANPWPLPYWIDPCWTPGVGLIVRLPLVSQCNSANEEYLILMQENDDAWVERIREDYWLGGWWEAVDLPYKAHPEGGLLVTQYLTLDKNITFACPWRHISKKTDGSSPEALERFMPPVPLNSPRDIWEKRHKQEGDGFFPTYVLVFEEYHDD